MVVLFTLWLVLKWQFPSWLWILGALIFIGHIIKIGKKNQKKYKGNNKNRKKDRIISQSVVLPFFLALALSFGSFKNGSSIIQEGQGWVVLFIFIISNILSGAVIQFDKRNKKSQYASIKTDNSLIKENYINDNLENEKHLFIQILKNNKSKSNFKISLKTASMFNKIIPKKVTEQMEEKGIDLNDIIKQINDGVEIGNILEVDDEHEKIIVSVK